MWFHDAVDLLRKSEKFYVEFEIHPPKLKPIFPLNIFQIGGGWMKKILKKLGSQSMPKYNPPFQKLGYFKYGLALCGAILATSLLIPLNTGVAFLAGVLIFYALEAQMVFLFPLSIEGTPNPIGESFRQTQRAGGTLKVMGTVMLVALYMVTGGFLKGSIKKSWCIGCLMVLVWYLQLNGKKAASHELV